MNKHQIIDSLNRSNQFLYKIERQLKLVKAANDNLLDKINKQGINSCESIKPDTKLYEYVKSYIDLETSKVYAYVFKKIDLFHDLKLDDLDFQGFIEVINNLEEEGFITWMPINKEYIRRNRNYNNKIQQINRVHDERS